MLASGMPEILRHLPATHPKTTDHLRALLARNSLARLLIYFIALIVAIAALLAIGFWATEPSSRQHSYWYWWRHSVLALSAFPVTDAASPTPSAVRAGVQVATALLGLILPALILGIIVFKAFVADAVFYVRKRLALIDLEANPTSVLPHDPYCLAIRLYSSTKLDIVEVNFSLYARIRGRSASGSPTVTNYRLRLEKGHWPIALKHVPYTIYVPLKDEDVHRYPDKRSLKVVGLQGVPTCERCRLLLHISGGIPDLNSEFTEAHWFNLDDDTSTEPFGEIAVAYDTSSKRWAGWDRFEGDS